MVVQAGKRKMNSVCVYHKHNYDIVPTTAHSYIPLWLEYTLGKAADTHTARQGVDVWLMVT